MVDPTIIGFGDLTVSQDDKSNLRLLCDATGTPTPKITWSHNGKGLDKLPAIDGIARCKDLRRGIYRHKVRDNVLIICRLNYIQHAGLYTCRADNTLSWVTEKMTLTVTGN